ncbi:hypothetical protein Cgig2_031629 [Carnegiea gigantea]|uniref:Uncharacterized protein n=1 Tax=Carnegiea gigantea TaxID=171969 RepID=A0A9Q1K862_9CARY|nr:hypothetical protein Cgig2_031629 [Carnegiea gigantea]
MGPPDEDFKFLLSIQSSIFPVRVLANHLSFIRALRQKRSILDLAQAHADLQRVPLHEAPLATVEHSNAVVTTIIPMPDTSDDLVEAVPIQSIPISLIGYERAFSKEYLLASRMRVSQSLSALCSMIDIYKLKEIFGVVETTIKIEDLVDVDRVKVLSDQDLTCSSEIAHIEDQVNNLSSKASKLKVKKQEVLREEERIRKIQEDLTVQHQILHKVEGKLKFSLDSKKKEAEQLKADLVEAGFSSYRIWGRKRTILRFSRTRDRTESFGLWVR